MDTTTMERTETAAKVPTRGQEQMAQLEAALADKEKQLETLHSEMNALRRELARIPVQDYPLQDFDGNTVSLSDAFGEHDRLLLIHNMGFACPYCTLWAEGFNGYWKHFESKDYATPTKFLLVSNDRPDQQKAGAALRGWNMPMLSARGTSLFEDLGFLKEYEGKPSLWPGASALKRNADGSLERTGMVVFGPGDAFCGFWHFQELFEPEEKS
jgi:predicted dithiol-disulfide oxidoreductase (DUF899 family)